MTYMGIIKDLWDSCELAKIQNKGPVYFDRWKDDHPQYVKTPASKDNKKHYRSKARTFDGKIIG